MKRKSIDPGYDERLIRLHLVCGDEGSWMMEGF
jgi:hypothetical protein